MSFDSVTRTLLGIEKIGLPNVGILLDFGHSLYGGESPADAAQLAIDYGRLFGMDVNDNLRGWDDDLVAGTVDRGLDRLDFRAMQTAQDQHDALTALRFAQQACSAPCRPALAPGIRSRRLDEGQVTSKRRPAGGRPAHPRLSARCSGGARRLRLPRRRSAPVPHRRRSCRPGRRIGS
jgi:hypothetical protein